MDEKEPFHYVGIEMIKVEPPAADYCLENDEFNMSDEDDETREESVLTNLDEMTLKPLEKLPPNTTTVTEQGLEIIKLGPTIKTEAVSTNDSTEQLADVREIETKVIEIKKEIEDETPDQSTSSQSSTKPAKETSSAPPVPRDKPVSTGKTYYCDTCGKKFSQLCHLKNHVHIHTGDKPYECEVCHKRFNQSSVLKRHLMIHSGDRPHGCKLCGKKFTHLGNLRKHEQTHTDDKKFECEICQKKFNLQCYLRKHKMTHTDVRPFECNQCGKRFLESGNLKSHLVKHSTDRPFKCEQCPKAFKHLVSLTVHKHSHYVVIKQ